MAAIPPGQTGLPARHRCSMRRLLLIPVAILVAAAQEPQPPPPIEFTCPMDPDVRSKTPGKCPRCGMALEAGIQQPVDYLLNLTTMPASVLPGKPVELRFELIDSQLDRKSTRLNSSHLVISYAVFCLKK